MALTLTFFARDANGGERVLRRTVIPDEALTKYQASPEGALLEAQDGQDPKPDGFRITDDRAWVRMRFRQDLQSSAVESDSAF